ncbi:MAG: hypothetical protein HC897_05945 [Thermoanaerobaculia bacterium]|nr:hypothetical protein [Thermoanaerobaculia bacterium]
MATFKDEIFVFDTAPIGFEIPSWVLSNWFVDVGSHFDNSRFDFSEQAFSGWEGWEQQGCDEWCQIFAEVGQASTATNFLELGVTTLFEKMILGPLSSKGGGFIRTTVASRYETLEKAAKLKYPKKAGRLENHHKKPIYLGGDRKGETVKIDAAYHQEVTNAFRKEWGYGQGPPEVSEVESIMQAVYTRFPLP